VQKIKNDGKRRVKMLTPTGQLARLRQDQADRAKAAPDHTAFGELSDIDKLVQAEHIARITDTYLALATV
jgi:hypothetical protein